MTELENKKPHDSPFVATDAPRMVDVLSWLDEAPDLSATRLRDMKSAVKSMCRLIKRRLEEVPANINWVHVRLRRVHPASVGMSKKRFANIKSDLLAALALTGCSRARADWLRPPSPAWQALLDRVVEKRDSWKLSQFAQYCSAHGVSPQEVSDDHVRGLVDALKAETFQSKPDQVAVNAVKTWNRLSKQVDGWPNIELTAPRRREPWTTSLDRFPQSFQDDVAKWIDRLANPDPLSTDGPMKPLRPATIKHRHFQIQEMASALLHEGHAIELITSLSYLVEIDNFKDGLRYMIRRFDNSPTEAIHGLAMGMKAIATHHVKVDETHLDEMRGICQRINLDVDGLREKNRERLAQLDDPQNLAQLLHLPEKLVRLSERSGLRPHKAALLIQAALAIEILLFAPMRIGNLANLHLDQHLRAIKVDRETRTLIDIPGEEVKNGKPLHFELESGSTQLLERYRTDARPVLLRERSDYLFPAQNGGPKRASALSELIKKTILEHTGMTINAHLFRSIAGKIHNIANPGDFVTLAHVLGDSLPTTMRSYAQFLQQNSLKHYQRSVDQARANCSLGA